MFAAAFVGLMPVPGIVNTSLGIAFYLLIGCAGVLLFATQRLGYPLTLVCQALQILHLFTFPATFSFLAGPYLVIAVSTAGPNMSVGLKVNVVMAVGHVVLERMVGINVVPIAILWFLYCKRRASYRTFPDRSPVA